MAKFLIVLAFLIFTSQCAVFKSNGDALKRVARSPCNSCENNHNWPPPPPPPPFGPPPPPPPPPPPMYQAQHWTGYLQSADGSQQGVFSGAAASARAADNSQESGQAYALSGAGASSGPAPPSPALQASQGAGSQASAGANSLGGYSKSNSQSFSNGGFNQVPQSGQLNGGPGNQQYVGSQASGFKNGGFGGYNSQYERNSHAQQTAQSSLRGALDLAAQGLQGQQGQYGGGGCSTCGKSNYALSNARSQNGNAVAVSVNGK